MQTIFITGKDHSMTPNGDRFTEPSTTLDFLVNLVIATGGIVLVILGFYLFA